MGFFDSFLAWLVLIIIIAFLLFAIFSYFLGWFYPTEEKQVKRNPEEEQQQIEKQQRQRKWVGIFILVAMIIIMGTTGANAFINQKAQ